MLSKGAILINEEKCLLCGCTIPEGRMLCKACEDAEPNFDTAKIRVNLKNSDDILEFVCLANKCKDDVVVKFGNFAVDGKSLIFLHHIDTTHPLSVEIYGLIPYEVKEGMKKFILN